MIRSKLTKKEERKKVLFRFLPTFVALIMFFGLAGLPYFTNFTSISGAAVGVPGSGGLPTLGSPQQVPDPCLSGDCAICTIPGGGNFITTDNDATLICSNGIVDPAVSFGIDGNFPDGLTVLAGCNNEPKPTSNLYPPPAYGGVLEAFGMVDGVGGVNITCKLPCKINGDPYLPATMGRNCLNLTSNAYVSNDNTVKYSSSFVDLCDCTSDLDCGSGMVCESGSCIESRCASSATLGGSGTSGSSGGSGGSTSTPPPVASPGGQGGTANPGGIAPGTPGISPPTPSGNSGNNQGANAANNGGVGGSANGGSGGFSRISTINSNLADNDGDGFSVFEDCNDNDANINPRAEDIGDGIDNDCNGVIDQNLPEGWVQAVDGSFTKDDIEIIKDPLTDNNKLAMRATSSNPKAVKSEFIPVFPEEIYSASITADCTRATLEILWFDENKNLISEDSITGSGKINITTISNEFAKWAVIKISTVVNCEFDDAIFVQSENPVAENTENNPTGCCSKDSCYDSETGTCVSDTALNSRINSVDTTGLGCVSGKWGVKKIKYDYKRENKGFCPRSDQCLVNPLTVPPNNDQADKTKPSACIKTGQYIEDKYCDAGGNWSTRTKQVALTLLDYISQTGSEEYTLFCDSPKNALGFEEQKSLIDTKISQCENGQCFTNICVLQYGDKTAFGMPLTSNVDDDFTGVLDIFKLPKDSCDGAKDNTNSFIECTNHPKDYLLHYNDATDSVILIPEQNPTSIGGVFSNFIRQSLLRKLSDILNNYATSHPFSKNLKSLIDKVFPTESFGGAQGNLQDFSFFRNVNSFDKIYYKKIAGKEVFAFYEKKYDDDGNYKHYIGFNIKGFGVDQSKLCNFFRKQFPEIMRATVNNQMQCVGDSDSITIVAYQTNPTNGENIDFFKNWDDLTAKIRIK